jgi:type II secretory pathway pseudopilin PulG
MSKVKAKLSDSRGETLPELLASIMIGTLSVSLLVGGVAVSAQMNRKADAADEKFYNALSAAERKQEDEKLNASDNTYEVEISEGQKKVLININLFGGDGIYSYQMPETEKGESGG